MPAFGKKARRGLNATKPQVERENDADATRKRAAVHLPCAAPGQSGLERLRRGCRICVDLFQTGAHRLIDGSQRRAPELA